MYKCPKCGSDNLDHDDTDLQCRNCGWRLRPPEDDSVRETSYFTNVNDWWDSLSSDERMDVLVSVGDTPDIAIGSLDWLSMPARYKAAIDDYFRKNFRIDFGEATVDHMGGIPQPTPNNQPHNLDNIDGARRAWEDGTEEENAEMVAAFFPEYTYSKVDELAQTTYFDDLPEEVREAIIKEYTAIGHGPPRSGGSDPHWNTLGPRESIGIDDNDSAEWIECTQCGNKVPPSRIRIFRFHSGPSMEEKYVCIDCNKKLIHAASVRGESMNINEETIWNVRDGDRVKFSATRAGLRMQSRLGTVKSVKKDGDGVGACCVSITVTDDESGEDFDLHPDQNDTVQIVEPADSRPVSKDESMESFTPCRDTEVDRQSDVVEMSTASDPGMQQYYDYLDKLRDSGTTNMFGAGQYLQNQFGLDRQAAKRILQQWMAEYSDDRSGQSPSDGSGMKSYLNDPTAIGHDRDSSSQYTNPDGEIMPDDDPADLESMQENNGSRQLFLKMYYAQRRGEGPPLSTDQKHRAVASTLVDGVEDGGDIKAIAESLTEDHSILPPEGPENDYDNEKSRKDADHDGSYDVHNPSDPCDMDDEPESQPDGSTTYKRGDVGSTESFTPDASESEDLVSAAECSTKKKRRRKGESTKDELDSVMSDLESHLERKHRYTEKSPKGWEPTIKAMKKHKSVDNPYALTWWMKGRGYKSHK